MFIMDIKTFVFLDSETTGLPSTEYNKTKITELCLISVQADHITFGAVPRVQNKLIVCFNPWKLIQPHAEHITGLSNDLLENQSSFDDTSLDLITNFLKRLQKPVCFVAHNGFNFDYPILRTHIENVEKQFPGDIFCIDSLHTFRNLLEECYTKDEIAKNIASANSENSEISDEWDTALLNEVLAIEEKLKSENHGVSDRQMMNEATPVKRKCSSPCLPKHNKHKARSKICFFSDNEANMNKTNARRKLNFDNRQSFKLVDVYERLLQKIPENMHHAEADVKMMMECAVHLGDRFINWANNNAIPFNLIPKMEPGRPIYFKHI